MCFQTHDRLPLMPGKTSDYFAVPGSCGYTVVTEKQNNNKAVLNPGKLCQQLVNALIGDRGNNSVITQVQGGRVLRLEFGCSISLTVSAVGGRDNARDYSTAGDCGGLNSTG
jgi:hypothetical protein